jgi:hypothetical protein
MAFDRPVRIASKAGAREGTSRGAISPVLLTLSRAPKQSQALHERFWFGPHAIIVILASDTLDERNILEPLRGDEGYRCSPVCSRGAFVATVVP